jgi:hypothetical protein
MREWDVNPVERGKRSAFRVFRVDARILVVGFCSALVSSLTTIVKRRRNLPHEVRLVGSTAGREAGEE